METLKNTLSTQQLKIIGQHKTNNYFEFEFMYNNRNYYMVLTNASIIFETPINNNYAYKVLVDGYNHLNLTKEDLESIIYFKVIQ